MRAKVRIKKSQLNYFRSKARDTNLEIQALLIGEVVSPELTVVESFAYPKKYHTQTPNTVTWFQDEWDAVKRSAEERGKRIVGDIHSHPRWDAVLSPSDYKSHIEEGMRICGIVSTMGRKTRVRFWIAESALNCELEWQKTNR
jgi:proteasome lid subunit RPN8/RPN11